MKFNMQGPLMQAMQNKMAPKPNDPVMGSPGFPGYPDPIKFNPGFPGPAMGKPGFPSGPDEIKFNPGFQGPVMGRPGFGNGQRMPFQFNAPMPQGLMALLQRLRGG